MADQISIHTHFFLVGKDLMPHLTPVYDEQFCPKKAYLIGTAQHRAQADRLHAMLSARGVSVSHCMLDDPWDIDHIQRQILELVTAAEHDDIALNLSGGTTSMILGAYDVFCSIKKPVYCIAPGTDDVIWLHDRRWRSIDLADTMTLKTFFAAHDKRIISETMFGVPEHLKHLTRELVINIDDFSEPLGTLNAHAYQAKNGLFSTLDANQQQNHPLQKILGLFSQNKLLSYDAAGHIVFENEAARSFVNGGWFEWHVYGVLFEMRHQLQDLARNIEFEWAPDGSPVKNELDVAFLADNRLYIIECKTLRFAETGGMGQSAANTLYKLRALRDCLGGVDVSAMLTSYRQFAKHEVERAEKMGLTVCHGRQIQNLHNIVQRWMEA